MIVWLTTLACTLPINGQTIDEAFENPPQEARPLIIWQWMDGMVSAEGIILYQPYGTNSSKPFNPINTEAIVTRLKDDYFCTEFWTNPQSWGWTSVPRHMQTVHKLGIRLVFAEGFTCWPLSAWQEDPASQKALADHAFCLGVNSLQVDGMLLKEW